MRVLVAFLPESIVKKGCRSRPFSEPGRPQGTTVSAAYVEARALEPERGAPSPAALRKRVLFGSDDVALDVGCGPAVVMAKLAPDVARIVGVEPYASFLDRGRVNLAPYRNASLLRGVGSKLPFRDRAFTRVLCQGVFHQVGSRAEAKAILSEMIRVTKRGGIAFLGETLDRRKKRRWFPPREHMRTAIWHENPMLRLLHVPASIFAYHALMSWYDSGDLSATCRVLGAEAELVPHAPHPCADETFDLIIRVP